MTFEEAVSLVDRIKEQVIGVPVKGRLIESLFIGPTNWNEMHVFMNICLQKGEDEAIDEFIGKSFSVYGRSVTYINPDLPRWDVTVLDDWEKLFIIERGSLFGYLFFYRHQRRTTFSINNYITHIRLIIKITRYIFYHINIIICPIFVLSIKDFNR